MIKLIATDMDGSLLDDDKNLPPDFSETHDILERNGISFAAASGRSYTALAPVFGEQSSSMSFICDNGAFIVHKGKKIFSAGIAPELLREVISVCEEKLPEAYLVLCGEKGLYVTEKYKPRSQKELGFYYSSRIVLDNLAETDDVIFKIAIYDENNPQEYSYPVLEKIFGDKLSLVVSGHLWMDIMQKGISKGSAVKQLQQTLGITAAETMAFGDFYNDIELLKNADMSFVMENANEDMKQYGRFTAESNNSSGVTKAIKKYLTENGLMHKNTTKGYANE